MGADDKTPTGRDLDKALDYQEASLTERHRQRLSSYEDEDSTVIEQRAAESVKSNSSTPPRAKALAMLLGALAYSGALTALVAWAGN
jgi:hypothetical protein